jgi:hypothetical protein
MERNSDTDMRWSVVTLVGGGPQGIADPDARGHVNRDQSAKLILSDAGAARTALDRIVIPQDVLGRLAGLASQRSSLIISDESLSSETGKGTDFIVLLSGEPQGSLKIRRRAPAQARYNSQFDRLPWRRAPSWGRYSTR